MAPSALADKWNTQFETLLAAALQNDSHVRRGFLRFWDLHVLVACAPEVEEVRSLFLPLELVVLIFCDFLRRLRNQGNFIARILNL